MWTRSDLRFQVRRATGLLKVLLTNKRAALGVFLLAAFLIGAIAAPVVAPVPPNDIAAAQRAQPGWVTNFPDGYYLSRNIVVVDDPTFKSPASLQPWTLTTTQSTASNILLSYAAGIHSDPNSQGSLQLVYTGTGPASVNLAQTFQYPYHGPPGDFVASFAFLVSAANQSLPLQAQLFIAKDSQTFNLLPPELSNVTRTGIWFPPSSTSIESASPDVTRALGLTNSALQPAEIIFSSVGSYRLGVSIAFNGPARVNIGSLQLRILGTAYGLLGTDNSGHDLWSQNVYGSRISLFVGLVAAGIGIGLGLVVGVLAGFLGRLVDEVLMRFTDMMLVIPLLPLLIVLVGVLGQKLINVIIIIGFLGWMGFARIVRSQVLSLRERPFVEAAKAAGAGPFRIMSRHIFPNIVSLTYVNLALSVPAAILTEAALAFIGLSDPSVVSWGNIYELATMAGALNIHPPPWWWLIPPGVGIALVSLSFILIGFALDEIFNPRLRRRR
jgi:ABC-type dipeptide/oligopeptide/nickel transport system permease subunit